MPKIVTFLTYNGQAEEAAELYTSVFPDSRITRISRYPELAEQQPAPAGSIMMVEFELAGRPFIALNGGPSFTFSQGISISVLCDTQDEIDTYWRKLTAEGGQEVACGWLTDRFGVSWQITPRVLMDFVAGEDPAAASRAMSAMITMTRIDAEAIRRAGAGN